jgi:hypothetical protein
VKKLSRRNLRGKKNVHGRKITLFRPVFRRVDSRAVEESAAAEAQVEWRVRV